MKKDFFIKYEQWIALAIFVWTVLFWILNLAAVLAPWHAEIIIEAGLIPFILIFIGGSLFYLILGMMSKVIEWKKPEFWIPIISLFVVIIGVGLCWGEIVPHYAHIAENLTTTNGPQTPETRLLCAAQWISVIILGFNCAGWWWIFFRSYRIHNWNDGVDYGK